MISQPGYPEERTQSRHPAETENCKWKLEVEKTAFQYKFWVLVSEPGARLPGYRLPGSVYIFLSWLQFPKDSEPGPGGLLKLAYRMQSQTHLLFGFEFFSRPACSARLKLVGMVTRSI